MTRETLVVAPPLLAKHLPITGENSEIVSELDSDGLATINFEESPSTNQFQEYPPRSMRLALDISASDSTSDSNGEEDYDSHVIDPKTVVIDGKGGGLERGLLRSRHATGSADGTGDEVYRKSDPARTSDPQPESIPITFTQSEQEGKYLLLANDDEVKELLRMSLERESGSGKRRTQFSDLVFTRQFTAFDSHNTLSARSPFHGFFNLFWLATFIFMIRLAAKNWAIYGNILGSNDIMKLMLERDLVVLGLSDGVLCAATLFSYLLQRLILNNYITWNGGGWIIQNGWQLFYMFSVLSWTLYREWPWTHTVFFVLHSLVMLMKQHSYAFYNGYLSEAFKRQKSLRLKLKDLERVEPVKTPSATTPAASSFSSSYLDLPSRPDMRQRRYSTTARATDIAQVAAAIESGEPLDLNQIRVFERIIKWEIEVLSEELKGKSSTEAKVYPKNLTLANHLEFIVLPTVVYEQEYPRSDSINWFYVAEKAVATAGILLVMMLVSQTFIYPVVVSTLEIKNKGVPLHQRLKAFPWILSDLIFPFMMEYMMVWYVIWECILNLLAELTYFADRGFYADWWNSVSWDQFARDWNRPVHNFLLRHVYHSSISTLRVNKYTATLITFFLSACVHELIMWCLFKKLRGYLLFLQMMQVPLVQLSRTRFLKGRATLGNLIFWIGIFTGPSFLCSLYLIL